MADVTVTAASVLWTGSKDTGLAGATITRGQPLYMDATDGNRLKPADADVAATSAIVGIALNDAADEQPVEYGYGDGTLTVGGAGVVVGQIYVVSTTAGGIAPYSDLLSGDFVAFIGVGATTSTIKCKLFDSQIAKA